MITAKLISLNTISMLSFDWTLSQRNTCPVSLQRLAQELGEYSTASGKKSVLKDKDQIEFEIFHSLVSYTVFSKRRIIITKNIDCRTKFKPILDTTENQQNTWWYHDKQESLYFWFLFYSSPCDVDNGRCLKNVYFYCCTVFLSESGKDGHFRVFW